MQFTFNRYNRSKVGVFNGICLWNAPTQVHQSLVHWSIGAFGVLVHYLWNKSIFFHEVFHKMCSMKYVLWSVPWNVFHKICSAKCACEMCSGKCSTKCVPQNVPQNVFQEMCSMKCSTKCVLQNMFHEMCSVKCVPQSVLWNVFHKMCSTKCSMKYVLWNVFREMCSMKCSMKCVPQNMFCKVFCKMCSMKYVLFLTFENVHGMNCVFLHQNQIINKHSEMTESWNFQTSAYQRLKSNFRVLHLIPILLGLMCYTKIRKDENKLSIIDLTSYSQSDHILDENSLQLVVKMSLSYFLCNRKSWKFSWNELLFPSLPSYFLFHNTCLQSKNW